MRSESVSSPSRHPPQHDRSAPPDPAIVALIGNPNTGKTALFNALTGFRRHVANYAGVTVDIGRAPIRGATRPLTLLDLPGTYSLAAHSPDELIVVNVLGGRVPDLDRPAVVLVVLDAANPVRNCYLLSQLVEFELPVVVALNMVDLAEARGIHVDARRLADKLGVPVVPVVATRPKSVLPVVAALEAAVGAAPPTIAVELPPALREEAVQLRAAAAQHVHSVGEALRILVDRGGCAERQYLDRGGSATLLDAARQRHADAGVEFGAAEVRARYSWIHETLDGVITRTPPRGSAWSDRIDAVLTHRVGGAIALLIVLYGLFYAIYRGALPLMDLIGAGFDWLGVHVAALLPAGMIQSLVVDGLIGGVGGVLTFVPQIVLLFMFIALLEDCGYLSRAAFMVDRLMRPLGLSGRAFIPLLSAFACAVPAILGTRAIADRRERVLTILLIPFMSCSARLPIYVLLIGAFVPARSWLGGWLRLDALVMLGMYLVGVVCAIPVALLLKRTVFAGPSSGFLLELPHYKLPRLRTVWQRMYLAGRSFIVRAGTVILLVNLAVWALGYFPRSTATQAAVEQQRAAQHWSDTTYETQLAGAYLRDSYLGRLGHGIEPVLRPLGWDWRIGVAVISSFPAREVVIAALGTVFNLDAAPGEERTLQQAVRTVRRDDTGRPLFSLPVALSLMVFFALCAQCTGTLAVIKQELGSWLWPAAVFVGMTTLAYGAAWVTYATAAAITG